MMSKDQPLVSVIIPCYNQANYLGEAIESVFEQSHRRFEIIVVNDGSPDNTSEVAALYPQVREICQRNQGLAVARNVGFQGSKGEYLVFLDADDRLLPNALEIGLGYLTDHPKCAFVSGQFLYIAADGSPLPPSVRPPIEKDHYLELLRFNYIGMHSTVVYRRAMLESAGGFDISGGVKGAEDYDLYLRIARRFPVYSHNKAVAEYRQHGSSMSRNSEMMLQSVLTALRSQKLYIKGNKRYEKVYKEGVQQWQEFYGEQIVEKLRAKVREGHGWRPIWQDARAVMHYYPRGFVRHAYRKLGRTLFLPGKH